MWRAEKNYYDGGPEIIFEYNGWDMQVFGADKITRDRDLMASDEDGLYMFIHTYGPTKKRRTGRMWLMFPRSQDEVY